MASGDRATRRLWLHEERFPGQAVLDTAVSHAMLRSVAAGDRGDSLRLYAPDAALLFSSLDARRPGYARAVEVARGAGYTPVIRLAGGHAAVFLESALAFAWASAESNAQLGIRRRFEDLTRWFVAALRELGLDARVGPVPGEYCPGEYSVNVAGRIKVMGVGQRVIRGGAHVGGVLTVRQSRPLREILVPIYEALDLEFRPETAGGIADFDASLEMRDVCLALQRVLEREGIHLELARFGEDLRSAAEALIPFHDPALARGSAGLRGDQRLAGSKVLLAPGRDDAGSES